MICRHHNSSRPKSQPPLKLSEMVSTGAANKKQHQQRAELNSGKLRGEQDQHWMKKCEESPSLRFGGASRVGSSRNLKTLCENQIETDCNAQPASSFARLGMLELVPGEADISPLGSSSGSSSSGGSSLASSTMSLSSVSSASTVMAVESHKKIKSSSSNKVQPLSSRKDSLGSDEESSSNSSSCSSSSGISSIGQASRLTTTTQVVDLGSESFVNDRHLELAVAESLEALVSSVAASRADELAPLALDVLMVKRVPVGEESDGLQYASTNMINQRAIINKCRRHIFNALTHAQRVGQREAAWRVELQLSTPVELAQIKWFKEGNEIGAGERDNETATIISAARVIDCLVEHELVIWLVSPKSERAVGKSCGPTTTSLRSIDDGNEGGGRQAKQLDAKLAACSGESSRGSDSSSPVCGNLIGITNDGEQDQMILSRPEFQHVESIIWLCSSEFDAEQVQEAWREFGKRRLELAREELVPIGSDEFEEVAQMDAMKSTNFIESFPINADGTGAQESICIDEVPIEVADDSQLSDCGGGDDHHHHHLDDDDKAAHCDENRDGSNQLAKRDVMEADSSECEEEASSRQQTSVEEPRGATGSQASGPMANNGQATTCSTRLRRTVSVFNLAFRNENLPRSHNEPLESSKALGSGANSASSQFLTTCGADLTGKQSAALLVGRHSVSSRIIKNIGQEIQRQSCLASPLNQIDRQQQQQQQRRTFLKVGSTCDLSSSGQQLAEGRQLISANLATTKRTDVDHPQQQARASNASANSVSASAPMAPVVKPRMSILKRQVAAGSCLLSSAGITKGYQQQQQQQSGAKAAPSQVVVATTGKSAVGNQDSDQKCDLKSNSDRNRMGNSSRLPGGLEIGNTRLVAAAVTSQTAKGSRAAASIDKLNDLFECGSQSGGTRRRSVIQTDNCAQVVAVSSSSSVVKMSSKVPVDEQLAPREIRPREVHRSSGDLSVKLDKQPRRLLTGAAKTADALNRHQTQHQQQARQSRGQSIEACDELQSSRQSAAMATSRLEKVLARTPVADAASTKRQQQHEATINQATKTRRKAVHSLANCELLARQHQSQQQSTARAGDVTIKVTGRCSRGDGKSEVGNERGDGCGQLGNERSNGGGREVDKDDEVDFVATGSAAREQAFERLRQRASCYDITRLMSKNSIIQNQLARLKATGPSRSDSLTGSNNELRQRKPAELLAPNKSEVDQLESRQNLAIERGREAPARVNSETDGKRESILVVETAVRDEAQQAKVRSIIKSKVPVGGKAVSRHEKSKADDRHQDESEEVVIGGDRQSEKDAEDVRGDEDDKEEEEERDDEQENKKTNPSKAPAAAGLSKFNLLRQSFNQKTISSMLKFSSRASLRIKTSKPAQESAKPTAATQEQQVTPVAPAPMKHSVVKSSKTSETADQQQQKQIAALDSATLMLYNRHMQQRQQQKIIQQQQQQYAIQWQQHQIYIQQQQQQQQQQQRQQLAFMANQYVANHQHQIMSGIQLAPSLAPIGGYSTASSSMYAQQLMMLQQQQQQPLQPIPKTSSSNVVGGILRKSILKHSSSKAKEEQAAASRQMALGGSQAAAHHYAHAPSQMQQSHGPMVPLEVNHHSSVNIVYGAESRALPSPGYNLSGVNQYHLNEYLDHMRQQQYAAGLMADPKETAPGASSLKVSMRKRVKSILINRTGNDQKSGKKPDESQARLTQLQHQKPLKSALKSTQRRIESSLNLNSDGSDGDQSNSSTLESSSSSDRSNETPVQLKSALKKPSSSSLNTDEKKLISILSNADVSSTSSNSSDNSFKRAISARCSRRLTTKSPPKESTSEARVPMKPIKKNVTFSSKLTSIQ